MQVMCSKKKHVIHIENCTLVQVTALSFLDIMTSTSTGNDAREVEKREFTLHLIL